MHFKSSESFCTYFKDLLLHNQVKWEQGRGGEKMGQVTVGGGNKKLTYILKETIPLLQLNLYSCFLRHFSIATWLGKLTPGEKKNPRVSKPLLFTTDSEHMELKNMEREL